ncbi:14-3-3 protein [Diaporthe sp. PMI_573]|nr:14-3-3 protein [Diaporthaceae sp. PMI_573]
MANERENKVFLARLCKKAERYDDMASYMKEVATIGSELTCDERDLFSKAYKHVIETHRTSWRTIEKEEGSKYVDAIVKYRSKIELKLEMVCQDVLKVLDDYLIPNAAVCESKVFYHKMKGDYNRYLAEFAPGEKCRAATATAREAYKIANDAALTEMKSTHPLLLGLALNYSVFYLEVLKRPDRAFHLAKQALTDAIAELDFSSKISYPDSLIIMGLILDNLTLWALSKDDEAELIGAAEGSKVEDDVEEIASNF